MNYKIPLLFLSILLLAGVITGKIYGTTDFAKNVDIFWLMINLATPIILFALFYKFRGSDDERTSVIKQKVQSYSLTMSMILMSILIYLELFFSLPLGRIGILIIATLCMIVPLLSVNLYYKFKEGI